LKIARTFSSLVILMRVKAAGATGDLEPEGDQQVEAGRDYEGEQGGGSREAADGEQQGGQEGEGEQNASASEEEEPEILDPVNPKLRPDPRFFLVRSMLTGSMEPRHLDRKIKQPEAYPGFLVERDERW
jgi:hypothetical protein